MITNESFSGSTTGADRLATVGARAADRLRRRTGRAAHGVAFAPGRVNLIGEHTDYNDGFVLPMALEVGVAVAFSPRDERALHVDAVVFDETETIALEALEPRTLEGWPGYVGAVAWALEQDGRTVGGADLAIASDLPMGAGLSSSAALEVAVARALCEVAGVPWDPVWAARLCQRAENEFVGMACGIMDQLAASASREGTALLVDCRSLALEPVPIPDDLLVVVMDTAVTRSLTSSAYNDRRAACERVVETIRAGQPHVRALRDVDTGMLGAFRDRVDEIDWQRARHVVQEIARPPALATALREDDRAAVARLMRESHASLRDLYEVSCPELDTMVEIAEAHRACVGARMTGGGFGGCAVAIVEQAGAKDFVARVAAGYRERTGRAGRLFTTRPGGGARLLPP